MHRSGTSLIASIIQKAGLFIEDELNEKFAQYEKRKRV
jgi:hypothetical protein